MKKTFLLWMEFNPTSSYPEHYSRELVLENYNEDTMNVIKYVITAMKDCDLVGFKVGLYDNYKKIVTDAGAFYYEPIGESLV